MSSLVIVNNPNDWPVLETTLEVVPAKAYLTESKYSSMRGPVRVFNLCRSYTYQSVGYYVSLLASARGHRPLPTVAAMQDLKSAMVRLVSDELEDLIQKSLAPVDDKKYTMNIYFGKDPSDQEDRLAGKLFGLFEVPLLRANFVQKAGRWQIQSAGPLSPGDIPVHERLAVLKLAEQYSSKTVSKKKKEYRYDIAILHNPAEENSPSDPRALKRFIKSAESLGMRAELIQKEDYSHLAEYDALFIRETTSVNHHTYRFARRATAEGMVVIDDPDSILKCTNKVYLAELLGRHNIPHPKTLVIHRDNLGDVAKELGFPCILKQPDSSFSQGVVRASDAKDFNEKVKGLLERSDLVLAQEFVPTEFDWRIGVVNREVIYACRYYMAKKHWQIIRRDNSGRRHEGNFETVPLEEVPKIVVRTALKAANLIGDGLYGVDAKEIDGRCYIIEVNDNPSLDGGVEDKLQGQELYDRIMRVFLQRIEARKRGE